MIKVQRAHFFYLLLKIAERGRTELGIAWYECGIFDPYFSFFFFFVVNG